MAALHELRSYGEPGAIVYLADCVELMRLMPPECVDVIFADPPYRLSTGGVTVKSGRLAPVDKGDWDRSKGFGKDLGQNVRWPNQGQVRGDPSSSKSDVGRVNEALNNFLSAQQRPEVKLLFRVLEPARKGANRRAVSTRTSRAPGCARP